jgi:DNA-binding NarL/FixJ family response regulator
MINVFLADNHALSTLGLKYLLSTDSFNIREIPTFQHFRNIDPQEKSGLFILDYQYFEDSSLGFLKELSQYYPLLKVMVITSDTNPERMSIALEEGVSAFLTKDCNAEEILLAINALQKNEKFFCNKVYDFLIAGRKRTERPSSNILTQRENEILKLIVEGNSTQKIADTLFLSYHTINSHRKSICKKLKVKSPTELIIYALDSGMLIIK